MAHQGKITVITGGTGALGTAVSLAFLSAGAIIEVTYIFDHEVDPFLKAVSQFEGKFTIHKCEVTKEAEVKSLFEKILEKHGRIDILLNIVGGFVGGPSIAETEEKTFDFMLNLNLRSAFYCSKAAIPHMIKQKWGKIVCVSARAALKGTAGLGAYSISKAGVITLIETMAEEVKDHNINVNAILPSIIDTPANRKSMPDADHWRWVKPEAIAKVLLFLTSDDSSIINGSCIPVYGRA